MKLFLQKNAKFLSAGGSAPRPPKQPPPPHCEFLATRLVEDLGHVYCLAPLFTMLARAWYGVEWNGKWNGNFGMEYGRCQNGMEWKTIFHTFIPIPY